MEILFCEIGKYIHLTFKVKVFILLLRQIYLSYR